ncbi:CDP-alcohol phosphatidyltransferase family protein [Mastigocoleus testarum]|uniref:CDP-alcohol phosphatidyltransferase n=1 Tax=Mastigocoleus testarum BC008 TaxID=371196 RepID=A0A0V7ZNX2_9CYAN|nr:CDP-alcohol phosphatidyltransferase family protein [Mastigocoleus testarum]KST65958.1 hypothetical protein BC008_23565 [Mastigocoleus testarum BC008]
MFTLYQFKPAFQNCLRPLVNRFATWQISPNQITVSAILLSVAMGLTITFYPQSKFVFLLFPIILLLRMALNAIDGMLAREQNLTTDMGFVLNELGDIISDVALYLPFSFIPGIKAPWIITIVILAIIAEIIGFLKFIIDNKRSYEGPMGKSDRALFFAIISLVLGFGIQLESISFMNSIWVGMVVLLLWTIFNRSQ